MKSPSWQEAYTAIRCVSARRGFLQKCSDNILIHADKVADTAAHHKQMKDLMGAEILMDAVEYRKLQRINDAAGRIQESACEQP